MKKKIEKTKIIENKINSPTIIKLPKDKTYKNERPFRTVKLNNMMCGVELSSSYQEETMANLVVNGIELLKQITFGRQTKPEIPEYLK